MNMKRTKTFKFRNSVFKKSDFDELMMNINYDEFQPNEYVRCDMTDEEWNDLCYYITEGHWDRWIFGYISTQLFHMLHLLRLGLLENYLKFGSSNE